MSIDNILKRRDTRESSALLRRIADQKPNVTVTPTVSWPSDAHVTVTNPVKEVEVSNFGDVLRSLALLGKGVSQLNRSVSGIKLDIPDKVVQRVSGYVETNVSTAELENQTAEVAKSIKALAKEIKAVPKEAKVEQVTLEIPKSFKIDNLNELKRGFVSINDNLVKLADVIREQEAFEMPETDNTAVIGAVDRVEQAIKSIVFPIPTPTTPSFKDSSGAATSVVLSGSGVPTKNIPPDVDVTTNTNYARKYYTSTGAVTDGIVWSPAAGKRWHITSLYFQVSADCTVTFEDDKAGGDDPVLKGEFKAGSGLSACYSNEYPFASGEDAADLLVTTSAGNIYVTAVGYEV